MANWKIRSDDWTIAENQNGSSLTHYGVKGMRWGVRKEPDLKKDKRINQQKAMSKAAAKVADSKKNDGYPPALKKGRESWEKHQIANNRITSSFGSATYRREKGLDVSYKPGDKGTAGNYYVSTDGGKTYKVYGDDFLKVLTDMGYSKEDAQAMIDQYDKNWVEAQRLRDMQEADVSEEYKEEVEFNSQKNNFANNVSKTTMTEITKSKTWQEKVSDGAKKVGETLKKIGNQVASVAKKAAEAGKNFLAKLFNVKPGNKTTTRGTDKLKTNTKANSRSTSGINAYVPKNAKLQPTKRYKDIDDWRRKNRR